MTRAFAASLAVLALAGAAAQAQAPAAKPAASKPAMGKPAAAAPVRSAASLDCSKQADAKGLHGKARKTFRSSCKAAAKGK